jgi:hypothetical protein
MFFRSVLNRIVNDMDKDVCACDGVGRVRLVVVLK